MKLLTLLLSFYFLWLNVQPCTDHAENFSAGPKSAFILQPENHGSHAGDESCSPLCACACCNIQFIANSSQLDLIKLQFAEKNLPSLCQQKAKDIYFSFWQPPRVS
ncbi:MAG: hypothetical protein JST18_06315 [Bacteroidetes bacterium]|nr:hypothetical protein [Bacteroidota bacterium]